MNDDLVEKVASAIYPQIAAARDFHGEGEIPWEAAPQQDEWAFGAALDAARAAISAVEVATPPVTGEVGELVERLTKQCEDTETHYDSFLEGGDVRQAIALLKRYAATLERIASMADVNCDEAPATARAALSSPCSLR